MRFAILAVATFSLAVPVHADDKCRGEVDAAFMKQRAAPQFRTVATMQTPNGPLVRTIDFVAPDALYSKIESPVEDAAVETIGIGKWAWANTQGGWEEQPPHQAQMVTAEREAYKQAPKAAADFSCLGTVKHDGKDMIGYATAASKDTDGQEVVTTIYVDPASGLPAAYVVKAAKGGDEPAKFVSTYSYGKDIVIIAPGGMGEDSGAAADKQ